MGIVRAFRREQSAPEPGLSLPVRPPLKWAGGKRWQVPDLEPLFAKHTNRRLVEPFCGGLAVTTGLRPARALLNDVNPHVINFYQWLKRGLLSRPEMENDQEKYYEARARVQRAALDRQGRTRRSGVALLLPESHRIQRALPLQQQGRLQRAFRQLQDHQLHAPISRHTARRSRAGCSRAWISSSSNSRPDDFVYADRRTTWTSPHYSKGGFGWEEQERAAEWLSKHKGPVVLSNQATPRIVKLYQSVKFSVRFLEAPRRISCTGDRTPAPEVLATRNV